MRNLLNILLGVLICGTLQAQIPRLISFQGTLSNTQGEILADGNYNITVKIFDAASGGSELFSENHNVNLLNGVFSINIGSNTTLDLAFDAPYFISTTVNEQELLPRIAMTSSPYALNTAPKKRSISISPGMISDNGFFGVTRSGIGVFGYPAIDLPDAATTEFKFQMPVPVDYDGQGISVTALYTSSTDAGIFDCSFAVRGSAVGGDLNRGPGSGGLLMPAPDAAGNLAEHSVFITGPIDVGSRIISVAFRRRGDSATDTSTGTLRFVGFIIEYTGR